jgi:hypothetical protein
VVNKHALDSFQTTLSLSSQLCTLLPAARALLRRPPRPGERRRAPAQGGCRRGGVDPDRRAQRRGGAACSWGWNGGGTSSAGRRGRWSTRCPSSCCLSSSSISTCQVVEGKFEGKVIVSSTHPSSFFYLLCSFSCTLQRLCTVILCVRTCLILFSSASCLH